MNIYCKWQAAEIFRDAQSTLENSKNSFSAGTTFHKIFDINLNILQTCYDSSLAVVSSYKTKRFSVISRRNGYVNNERDKRRDLTCGWNLHVI